VWTGDLRRGLALVVAGVLLPTPAPASAGDAPLEVGSEANVYVRLGDIARLFVLAEATGPLRNGASDAGIGAHLDLTLKPIVRRRLRAADWERARYLWIRVGYGLIGSLDDPQTDATEHRGLAEAHTRVPLPGYVWLANRARVEWRAVDSESSIRFRDRLGVDREFTVAGTTLVPYIHAEVFYDTRVDAWRQWQYQAGVEIALTQRFRVDPSYTRQKDQRSSDPHLHRVGVALKFYY
jgi:hypothetical protein